MLANPISAHARRWLLIAGIIGIAAIWIIVNVGARRGRKDVITKAAASIDVARRDMLMELELQNRQMEAAKSELESIKSIADETERLRELAEFANKRNRR